jgi:hypothetical protein
MAASPVICQIWLPLNASKALTTPAVVVSFLATYLAAVFETPPAWLPPARTWKLLNYQPR